MNLEGKTIFKRPVWQKKNRRESCVHIILLEIEGIGEHEEGRQILSERIEILPLMLSSEWTWQHEPGH